LQLPSKVLGPNYPGLFKRKDGRSPVFIVVDALNEIEENDRKFFFELLKLLQYPEDDSKRPNISVLLVGRRGIAEELEDILESLPPMIEIGSSKNSAGIKRYINSVVARSKLGDIQGLYVMKLQRN
jgi:hypothetical protein